MGVRYRINGKQVSRKEFQRDTERRAAAGQVNYDGPPMTCSLAGWPFYSDAMGCHPKQIPEYRRKLARHGLKAEFSTDGRIKLESRAHRKQIGQALGYYDRDGGCGDPQRRSRS